MQNMWSENKILNNLINILIFLLAINFLHYGQLFLPAICLLIFIANHFKFKVKSLLTFIVLCLFAISFFVFSYDYGFYSVIGFCLPMAYYIGSNIKPNDDNVKKLIYLIAFGMACHVILNFIYDNYYYLITDGTTVFGRHSHYDIWLQDEVAPTGIATNYPIIIGCFYYLLFYEKNKTFKFFGITLLSIVLFYDLFLGRRTPLFILVISFCFSFIVDLFVGKKNRKPFFIIFVASAFFIISIVLMYIYNVFSMRDFLGSLLIVEKFKYYGFSSGRLNLLLDAIKIMPYHLWGGQEISSIIGEQIHDLWFDVYDFAGVVAFIILLAYTILTSIVLYKVIKKLYKNKSTSLLLYLGVVACCFMQLMLEPIMTGASLFMICVVIAFSAISSLAK